MKDLIVYFKVKDIAGTLETGTNVGDMVH